jgi:thiamine biosynthesis protein ThiS
MLTLEINGEARSVSTVSNVKELIEFLAISQDRIAVELNRRIIRRQEWATTILNDRDRVEIVQFVGGG